MSVFSLKNNAYEQYKFHKQAFKLLGGLDFNILIQKFFSEKSEQIYQLLWQREIHVSFFLRNNSL